MPIPIGIKSTQCAPSILVTGKNRQRSASAASAGTSADAIGTMASAASAAASNSRRASGASGGGGSTDNLADLNGGAQGKE